MKLQFDVNRNRSQADPFIFEDNGRFYLYVTAYEGVEAYSADSPMGLWKYEGVIFSVEGCVNYWAPSVIKVEGKYYVYVSCQKEGCFQFLHVGSADAPLGPYGNAKCLFERFTIDSHVVETSAGLFLWYAEDNAEGEKIGTRVFVDQLLDPYTPANLKKEVIVPTFQEEIFMKNRFGDGHDWYTLEGPFWFREGDWQYVMYSGGCYQNDTYHVGYAAAKSLEDDLTKVDFVKYTDEGRFYPVLIKNEYEEGTGHHSVLKWHGKYYAIYHGRDIVDSGGEEHTQPRTGRICELVVEDGVIRAVGR